MKWTVEQAWGLGLNTRDRWAFRYPQRPWSIEGLDVVIDLRAGTIVANSTTQDRQVAALDLPRFDHLAACVTWLRLRE